MALTKVTGDFIETGSITQGHLHSSHGITTSHITEGDKLFFTNARVDSRVGSLSTSDLSEGTNLYFTNARAIGALTAGTNIAIASNGTISSTDTNTTYTVGDGGLTQNNFTNTLKGKLDGIATSANNYSFPYTINQAASNSTVVRRHDSGYIFANFFNTTPNTVSSGVTQVCVETGNDGYIRHGTAAAIRSFINVADGANNYTFNGTLSGDLTWGNGYKLSNGNNSNNAEILSATTGAAGIVIKDSGGTFKMQLYGEGGHYGLLNSEWGGWDLRKANNGELTIYVSGTGQTAIHTGNIGSQTVATAGNAATATTASGQTSGSHFSLNNGGGGYGLVGVYNPDIHQGLFAMGSSYMLTASGGLGNFYGVSWSYDYSGRQLNTGSNLQHCLAVANAGTVATVIGLGIWTSGIITTTSDMRAPIFYDSNDTNYYIDANSTSRLNIIQGTEIYSHSWLRNHNANTGLYNQATVTHWYSDAQGYFNIGGGAGGQGIKLRDNHGTTVRGILYYDTSGNFGFLNSGSSWRIKCVGGDHVEFDGTSARAKIFYDQNNTTYYTDPASTSNLYNLNLTGAKHTYLEISPGNGHEAMVRFNGGSGSTWYVGSRTTTQTIGSTDAFHVYSQTAAKTVGGWDTGGNLFTTNSLRLTDSDSYIMGGSITSRAAVRAIDVGYASSSCFISASRTGSNPSMIMMGGSSNQNYIYNRQSGSNTTGRTMYCVVGTTTAFYVHGASGQVNFFGGTVGHSDRLSKRNIEDSSYGLDAVNNLRPRRFFWKNEIRSKEKQIGFIAQEVEEVLPEAVRGYEGDKGILDNALISVLTKAVQELSQQVTDLKAEVELLKQ